MSYNKFQDFDQEYLFLNTLYVFQDEYNSSDSKISSFYVKKTIFFAFFEAQLSQNLSLKKKSPSHVASTTVEHDYALREKTDVSVKNDTEDNTIHNKNRGPLDSEEHEKIVMTAFDLLNSDTDSNIRIKYQCCFLITHMTQHQRKKN